MLACENLVLISRQSPDSEDGEFPVWSKCFEAFVSLGGCFGFLLTDIDV